MALGSVFEILQDRCWPELFPYPWAGAGASFQGLRPCWDGEQDLRLKVSSTEPCADGEGPLDGCGRYRWTRGYDPRRLRVRL